VLASDPILGLQQPNVGESSYMRYKIPWKLIYVEIVSPKKEALIRENDLKKIQTQTTSTALYQHKNQLYNYLHNK
jgi:predicted GIY-YIG superfamily endonuclease